MRFISTGEGKARAARFIAAFGTEIVERLGLRGPHVSGQELDYAEATDDVRLRAEVVDATGKTRPVVVDDVGPYSMTDQRDLRDALVAQLKLTRVAALLRLKRAELWED